MIFRCVFSFNLFLNHTLCGQKYWGPMLHHLHYPCRNSLYTVFMLTLMPEEVWKSGALQLLSQKSTGNFYSLCASAQLQHHAWIQWALYNDPNVCTGRLDGCVLDFIHLWQCDWIQRLRSVAQYFCPYCNTNHLTGKYVKFRHKQEIPDYSRFWEPLKY